MYHGLWLSIFRSHKHTHQTTHSTPPPTPRQVVPVACEAECGWRDQNTLWNIYDSISSRYGGVTRTPREVEPNGQNPFENLRGCGGGKNFTTPGVCSGTAVYYGMRGDIADLTGAWPLPPLPTETSSVGLIAGAGGGGAFFVCVLLLLRRKRARATQPPRAIKPPTLSSTIEKSDEPFMAVPGTGADAGVHPAQLRPIPSHPALSNHIAIT